MQSPRTSSSAHDENTPPRVIRPRRAEVGPKFKVPKVPVQRLAKLRISLKPETSCTFVETEDVGTKSTPHRTRNPANHRAVSSEAPKTPLRSRNTVTAAATPNPHSPRTPRRTCKDQAMAKIVSYYETEHEMNLVKKAPAVTSGKPGASVPARRHTSHETNGEDPEEIDNESGALALARQRSQSVKRRSPKGSAADNHTYISFVSTNDSDFEVSDEEEEEEEEGGVSSEDGFCTNSSSFSSDTSSNSDDSSTGDGDFGRSARRRALKGRRRTTAVTRKAPHTPAANQVVVPRRTISTAIHRDTLNAKLHASRLSGDTLPCREQEFDTVFEFLFEHLQNRTGGCMYISGVPGTGKTATVNAVVRSMHGLARQGEMSGVIPDFQFVTVNGMQISEPRQVYVQVYEALKDKKVSAQKALSLLETEFCSTSRQSAAAPACVLLLDELDLLCSKRQDVLYALFDWSCRATGADKKAARTRTTGRRPLIILTVANTMDLPERVMHHRVASRLGLNRLAFAPYSFDQLAMIVKSRLGEELSSSFDPKAIELATRKVAAVSGDARRALDICRRAAELAQLERGGRNVSTTIQHVNAALREMFTAPMLTALRCVSHYERLLLRAIVAEVAARGVEEVQLNRCLHQLHALCGLEGVPRPTDTEVFAMCASLGTYKLILTEPSRRDTNMLLRLNCSQSDVLFALKAAS